MTLPVQRTQKNSAWQNGPQKFQPQTDFIYGKVPPQAKELEKAVLGAIMLEKGAFDKVSSLLKPECFYTEAHETVYRAFINLQNNSLPIDELTVVHALRASGDIEKAGGPFGIVSLTNAVTGAAHIEAHAQIILQKFMQREMIRISGEILTAAYNDTTDVFELLNESEKSLFTISNHIQQQGYSNAATLAMANISQVDALQNRTIALTGVPTGFSLLDKVTSGWQATDLIILAARPSVGKTAFALNLAINAATSRIKPTGVGFFSLEMSAGQLTNRIASYMSKVPLELIVRGRMSKEHGGDHEKYLAAMNHFAQLNIQIDESAGLSIHNLRSKARQMVSKDRVGMIIIDYLQLMTGDKERNSNREQEISTISRALKQLAKELKVPIIALSQMSRAIEGEKRDPRLSDLRESGAIENDADIVAFLGRDDYQQEKHEGEISNTGWAKICKHRNGTLEKLPFETELSTQTWREAIPQWKSAGISSYRSSVKDNGEDMPF